MMKFYFLLLAVLVLSNTMYAQEIAVTERGDSILVYSNGTWDYFNNVEVEDSEVIPVNESVFVKPNISNKKAIGLNKIYEIWYNGDKWDRVPPGELNPIADLAFKLKKGDVYAMVIFEEMEIEMESLSKIAIDNAIAAAPDLKVFDKEYRTVNNDTLISMHMDGTAQGMKISYHGYYSSNSKGSVQFLAFTGQSLKNKYKKQIEDLLNGFIFKPE